MKKLKVLIIFNILLLAVAGVLYLNNNNKNELKTSTSIVTPITTAGNKDEQIDIPIKPSDNKDEQIDIPIKPSDNKDEQQDLPIKTADNDAVQKSSSPLKDNEKASIEVIATPELVANKTPIASKTQTTNTQTTNTQTTNTQTTNKAITDNSSINKDAANKDAIIEKKGLVELLKLDDSFVIDIKYATTDNFTKKKIYTMPMCLIHKNTAQKLINANNDLKTLGYRIKVFDAYRPKSAQQVLWDAASDKSFLASPKKGSIHSRGAAVDVTLVDKDGKEIGMPSGYDEFSERAYLKYTACDQELIQNRELLGEYMVKHGFKRISNEWWHFEDINAKKYPLLDIAFEEFVQKN